MASRTMIKYSVVSEKPEFKTEMCKFGRTCRFIPERDHAFSECNEFRQTKKKNDGPCRYGRTCKTIQGKDHNWSECKAVRDETKPHNNDSEEKKCVHCERSVEAHPNDPKILMLCHPVGHHTSDRCHGCWCPKARDKVGKMVYTGKPEYKDAEHKWFGCGCGPENRMDEDQAIEFIETKTNQTVGHTVIVANKPTAVFPNLPSTDDKESKTNNNSKKKYLTAVAQNTAAAPAAASTSVTATTTPNMPVPFSSPISQSLAPITEEQINNTPRESDTSTESSSNKPLFEMDLETVIGFAAEVAKKGMVTNMRLVMIASDRFGLTSKHAFGHDC